MQEIRYAKVNNREIPVLISDEKEALQAAKAAGRAIVGLWDREAEWEDLAAAGYLVTGMEAVTEEFLERTARRHLGLPWRICETERLLIREIWGDDFDEIWENQVGHGFGSVEELEAYTKHQYGFYGFGFWALVEKEHGELVGMAGVVIPEKKAEDGMEVYQKRLSDSKETGIIPENGGQGQPDTKEEPVELELGYHIFLPYRRRGYAKESCSAILKYAKEELEADQIRLRISSQNAASRNLALKLGFLRSK